MCKITLALALWAAALTANGQTYPSRPIHVIAPFPPGASIDIVARTVGQVMSDSMGQPFVVDNKAGASGAIGTEFLARSSADGYTIGIGNPSTHVLPVVLKKKLAFDAVKDFAPLSLIAKNVLAIAVHPSLPVKSIRELVDYSKSRPGALSFSSPGNGTTHHLIGEMLNHVTGMDMLHVGYRGGGPAMADLLSGHVSVGVVSLTTVMPYAKTGRSRLIAIIDDRRYPDMPDIPTGAESYPGFDAKASWVGILAPAGLPSAIEAKLHTEIVKALGNADVRKRFQANGFEIIGSTPAEFRNVIASDISLWSKVAQARHISAE